MKANLTSCLLKIQQSDWPYRLYLLLVVAIYKFIKIACEIKLKNEATNSTFSKKLSENFELIHWFFNFIANLLSYQPSYFLSACAT